MPYTDMGENLDFDVQRHCRTGKRFYVAEGEIFRQNDTAWREERRVKNPEVFNGQKCLLYF